MDIQWEGEARPEFDDRIRQEVRDLMKDSDLRDIHFIHLMEIGSLENGPLIQIAGNGEKVSAFYIEDPEWVFLPEPC